VTLILSGHALEFWDRFAPELMLFCHLDATTLYPFVLACLTWGHLCQLAQHPVLLEAFNNYLETFRDLAADFGILPRASAGAAVASA
jgi:hypothetical protein